MISTTLSAFPETALAKDEAPKYDADGPPPIVYLKARFQHSKILPLKHEIYDILQRRPAPGAERVEPRPLGTSASSSATSRT